MYIPELVSALLSYKVMLDNITVLAKPKYPSIIHKIIKIFNYFFRYIYVYLYRRENSFG